MPGAPFPGFNQHLFDFGQHIGQNAWDQPFQNPYASDPGFGGNPEDGSFGPQYADPTTPGGMGMSPSPPLEPSPLHPGTHPAIAAMVGSGEPQQKGHFWGDVGQYLSSQEGQDSLLLGAIAGQMVRDPIGALRLAVQFRQQRDQRNWQAQQNDMQREAVKENIKAKAEAERSVKDQATFEKRAAKAQAQAVANGFDLNGWVGQNGPPTDDSSMTLLEHDLSTFTAQQKVIKDKQKEVAGDIANKAKIFGTVGRTGHMVNSEYTTEGNPKYDAQMAKDLPALADQRIGAEKDLSTLRQARIDRENALTQAAKDKLADGKPDPTRKAAIQKNLKFFGILESGLKDAINKLLEAKSTQATYATLAPDNAMKIQQDATVEERQKGLNDLRKQLAENEEEFTNLNQKGSALSELGKNDTGDTQTLDPTKEPEVAALLKKYPNAKVSIPAPATAPPTGGGNTESAPGADMALYYKAIESGMPLDKANAAWTSRHPGTNPPPPRTNAVK